MNYDDSLKTKIVFKIFNLSVKNLKVWFETLIDSLSASEGHYRAKSSKRLEISFHILLLPNNFWGEVKLLINGLKNFLNLVTIYFMIFHFALSDDMKFSGGHLATMH